MASRYYRIGVCIFLVVVIGAILAAIMLPEPQCAWNSGSCEKLWESLRKIGGNLAAGNPHAQLNTLDFIPYNSRLENKRCVHDADCLVERHGVRVRWRHNGVWSDVLFYPIALSDNIVIDPAANDNPTPQIVMVPVERLDEKILPNLHGCADLTMEQKQTCQLRRMKTLFSARGITHPIALLSDGCVRAMPMDEF